MFLKATTILFACVLMTASASAQWPEFVYPVDTIIQVNGNSIMLAGQVDTVEATDPVTLGGRLSLDYEGYRSRKENNKVVLNRVPVQLNGEKIYSPYGSTSIEHCAELAKGKKYLSEYIQKKTRGQYKKLLNAAYNTDIRNIVVNKDGRIVYYEYSGLYKLDSFNRQQISKRYLQRVNKKVRTLMDRAQMKPATVNNQPVAYRIKHYELL